MLEWAEAEDSRKQFLEDVQIIWDAAEEPADQDVKSKINVDRDWESLKKRMHAAESGGPQLERLARHNSRKFSGHRNGQQTRFSSTVRQALRVAAVVLVLVGGAVLFSQLTEAPIDEAPQEVAYQQISTDPGQRATVRLGDGSRVVLNVDSELRVPRTFDKGVREVTLEGEAYFDVADEADRPFIVESARATVEVLGTRFGVRAYADGQTRVVVEEGKVSVSPATSVSSSPVDLTAGQMGQLTGDFSRVYVSQVDAETFLSWREGRLTFRETPLSDVVATLERWYDIEGQFQEDAIRDLRLTASLMSQSLPDVLDVISMSLNIDYRIEGKTVIFSAPAEATSEQAHAM